MAILRARLDEVRLPAAARAEIAAFHAAALPADGSAASATDLFLGELRVRLRLALLRRHLEAEKIDISLLHDVVALASERATLGRRLVHLQRTRHLFELWHVFHRPLVFGMFVIVALHVGIAVYLGYASLL
jgi:hypothetical protein